MNGDDQRHYTAQICLNGHVVSRELENYPGVEEDYFSKCGARTVTACQQCREPLRGECRYAGFGGVYDRPDYCFKCGKPYPWTEAELKAANDLAEESELSESDAKSLKATFPDLVSDSAQTTVAASRFRRLVTKAGPLAADGFKTILVNVVTEAAKKIMFPAL